MEIHEATYLGSFPTLDKCPQPLLPEIAIVGRSNVGKSSLINMLCARKKLAHVSGRPGKTQAINFYRIDNAWMLVDLPGYGYARRSKGMIRSFGKMIRDYLLHRSTLMVAIVLIDANVPPQENDLQFLDWMGANEIPFVIAYTKVDRLKTQKSRRNIELIEKKLLEHWEYLPQRFLTSAVTGQGRDELLSFIHSLNQQTA